MKNDIFKEQLVKKEVDSKDRTKRFYIIAIAVAVAVFLNQICMDSANASFSEGNVTMSNAFTLLSVIIFGIDAYIAIKMIRNLKKEFEYPAELWLKARQGELPDIDKYARYSVDENLQVIAKQLFLDFFALMNYELGYRDTPMFIYGKNFSSLTNADYEEIDNLAKLMLNSDENFDKLQQLFLQNQKFRVLRTIYVNPYTDWK